MSGLNVVLPRNTENAPVSELSAQTSAFSHYNNLSAQLPVDPKTGALVAGGVKEQAEQCFKNIKEVVESIDHSLNDVIRVTIFLKNILDIETVDGVYKSFFPTYVPTRTVVAVADLPLGAQVQVEALVSNAEGTIPNAPQAGDILKYVSNTPKAPLSALSSQTVAFSHYNNITAQLPVSPETGQIVSECVKEQTAQCLNNIKAILKSIDVTMDDIVKVTIFVTDLADVDAVNEVYTKFFPDSGVARAVNYFPARTVVEVAGLPLHAKVQVEAVVSHGDGTPPQLVEDRHGLIIEAVNTPEAPASAVSSHSVAFSHYNNISAQLPVDAKGTLVAGGVKEQFEQCAKNIKAIIESVEHTLEDTVKVNLYLKDLSDLAAIDEVYGKYFGAGAARRVVGVANLPQGALVQVDAIFGNAEGTPPLV